LNDKVALQGGATHCERFYKFGDVLMKDAVAYMTWERVVPWKILSMVARPDKPPVPLGFGARNWDFHKLLEPGSQIWVVTRIANEFSLVGRVAVQDILDRNGGTIREVEVMLLICPCSAHLVTKIAPGLHYSPVG